MRNKKLMALCLSSILAMSSLAGCASSSSDTTTTAEGTTTSGDTTASGDTTVSGDTSAADSDTTASGDTSAADSDTTAGDTSSAEADSTASGDSESQEAYTLTNLDPMTVDFAKYVDVSGWKDIKITKEDITEDEGTVLAALTDELVSTYGFEMTEVTDGTVQMGDVANIDFKGFIDGEEMENGSGTDTDLGIGKGQFIPGFESSLVGMKAGETKTIDLTFPDPYTNDPSLSGKPVSFEVTVNKISRLDIDSITDADFKAACEAVAGVGETDEEGNEEETDGTVTIYDTLSAFVDDFKSERADSYKNDKIWELVMEEGVVTIDTCQELVDDCIATYIYRINAQLSMYGMSFDDYLPYLGYSSIDEFKEGINPTAVEYAKQTCAVGAIAAMEGIEPDKDEVDSTYAEILEYYENDEEAMAKDGYFRGALEFSSLYSLVETYIYENIEIQ